MNIQFNNSALKRGMRDRARNVDGGRKESDDKQPLRSVIVSVEGAWGGGSDDLFSND